MLLLLTSVHHLTFPLLSLSLSLSANINDRSQCGNRDSELAAIVEDEELISCKMNGQDVSSHFRLTLDVATNDDFEKYIAFPHP